MSQVLELLGYTGLTATAAGVGSTSFIRSVIMHNTGLGTARAGLYIHPNTESSQRVGSGKVMRLEF